MKNLAYGVAFLTIFVGVSTVHADSALTSDEVRAWAVRQGNVEYPGVTDDGHYCQFNLLVSSDGGMNIYMSLGQRFEEGGPIVYMGGHLSSAYPVEGLHSVEGSVRGANVDVEFTGKGSDDGYSGEDGRAKIRLERTSEGSTIMKAYGSSTSNPKGFVCRFVALVS